MKVSHSKHGAWTVLALTGRLDHVGAEELEPVLLPLMRGGAVALDFGGVEFVSSSGFRVLMRAEREQAAHQGRLLLGNMATPVRYIFDSAGLSQHFKITHDLKSALQPLGPGRG